jgi:hypothetical protein
MFYNKQELLTLRKHLGSSPILFFLSVLLIFLVFYVLFCLSPLGLVCPMLPVVLDCSSLIAPSVLSNVYLIISTDMQFLMYVYK